MIERTLYRPRDIISFVNLCLSQAQGHTEVSAKSIRAAEGEYSQIRMQALREEWQSAMPSLAVALPKFAKFGVRFPLGSITTKEFIEDLIVEIAQIESNTNDPIFRECNEYVQGHRTQTIWAIAKRIVYELYRIGAIGVKAGPHERFIYSHQDSPVIQVEMIDENTRVHIHPMLHRALSLVQDKGQ